MTVTAIISIPVSDSPDTTIQALHDVLKSASTPFVIGPNVQDPTAVQITSEWPNSTPPSWFESLNNFKPTVTLATLAHSPFAHTPSPPFMEFVKIDFPAASTAKPGFCAGIEADFARFEEILRRRGKMEDLGEVFLTTGWTEEYVDEKGEQVKSYVVVRGWEAMERFMEAVATEEFKEAVPVLIGWGVPYKLVCLSDRCEVDGFG
jgi:hypothetical protein